MRRSIRRVVGVLACWAMVITGSVGLALPAGAAEPDPGVGKVVELLGGAGGSHNLAAWTSGLAGIGAFGQPLPFLAASPGGLAGLDDLVRKGIGDVVTGKTTWDDLAVDNKDVDLGGGRTGTLDVAVEALGDGKRVHVTLEVSRTVDKQSLTVSSTSPKVELASPEGVTATVETTLSLWVVWTGPTTDRVYLASDSGHAPRLDVDLTARLSGTAKAAVGILGVELTSTDFAVTTHAYATINDPNNDGILAFDAAGTGDGELAATGSLEGLVTAGLDPSGSPSEPATAGSVKGSLKVTADTEGLAGLNSPANVTATVGVSWPDISKGSPTITAPDLATVVGPFLNLSLRDLADGLAQLATALTGIQQAKFDADGSGPGTALIGNLDLPFMRGTVADAVKANEVLLDFLKANVIQPPDPNVPTPPGFDASTVGTPKFSSLQDLLGRMKAAGMDLGNLGWDAATSKLSFHLSMTKKAPAAPVALDEGSARISRAGASYSANGLSLGAGDTPWGSTSLAGMRIVAGTSAGEIASNTAGSLTLAGPWIGGQPADTTPFVISGPEAQLGAVSFGDLLTDGATSGPKRGILTANSPQTFAKVSPSFIAELTVVLDLQEARTGADCIGFEGNTQACPFVQTIGGFKTQVDSLPSAVDRVMVRTGTPVLKADFPIESAVDFTANAGFFQVRLAGKLNACHSSASQDCSTPGTGNMMTIGLKQVGDAQHDVRLRDLFARLTTATATGPSQAGDLLDISLKVRAHADLTVSLPGAEDFLPGGASATASASWADLTKTSGPAGPQVDVSDLSKIFALDIKPGSQAELYAIVLRTLQTLAAQLAEAQPGGPDGIYSAEIPGIGTSLRDLMRRDTSNDGAGVTYQAQALADSNRTFDASYVGRTVVVGTQVAIVKQLIDPHTLALTTAWTAQPASGTAYTFRSPLDDAIDALTVSPPQNMQDLVKLLNDRLGSGALGFRYLEVGGTPNLVLDLDWQRKYATSTPIRLQLDGAPAFVAASTSGTGAVKVDGEVKVGLVVPLQPGSGPDDAASLKVLADSKLRIAADASFTGSAAGTLGPLTVTAGLPGGAPDTQAQLKANLALELSQTGAAANTPVSFSDFLTGLGVHFNASNTPVDCGEGLTTKLMVCGRVPLYASVAGGSPSPLGAAALRIPNSTDPAQLVNLTGNLPAPDDSKPRLEAPADLAAALADAIADFTQIGPGLDGYLAKIEQAMRVATFDGKLPFVGKDLQQGADSIGRLRAELKSKLGDIPATPKEAKDYVNTKLKDAIEASGLTGANLEVGYACTAQLEPAEAPTVTPTPTGSTTWKYTIVASQGDGTGTAGDTVPSGAGETTSGPAALDADNFNKLSWPKVTGATKYKVLREKDGGPVELVAVVDATNGATQSYTDKDPAAGTAYTPVGAKPSLIDCPADKVDGITIAFDIQQGVVNSETGCTGDCLTGKVPLDIGIPGLALRAGSSADAITYGLGMQLHLKAGISRTDGFVIYTHDEWQNGQAAPEFGLGARFDMPASMKAELSFLDIDVTKQGTAPLFAGAFIVDLKSKDSVETADSVLTIDDLRTGNIGSLFGITLGAKIKADWLVKASANSVLPGVQANFTLDWAISNKTMAQLGAPTIEFKDIKIDAGSFFSELLGPVLQQVKSVTGPIQPVVDTLYAPIPVLSDLSKLAGGDDVSLMVLAKTFNTMAGGPDLSFVDRMAALTTLVNDLPDCQSGTNCLIPIGSFSVPGDKALATSVSPTSATGLVNALSTATAADLKNALNTAGGGGSAIFGSGPDAPAADQGLADKAGFSFPILDNPASVFSLLMGSDVALVEFDSGALTLGFTWRQSFGPVYAPPPVMVTLAGSASVSLRIMAGLDTAGIRYAVEAARAGTSFEAVKLLDGLYFKTTDKNGLPVPVVRLDGEIAAGAAVSAVVVTVGIEGGLRLKIGFYWNDPNNDGKFRVSEFLQTAINNPLCLFTTSGRLSLFLRLYITFGFSPFSVTFSFTLADITLLDFTAQPNCTPPPPRLGGTVDDTLVVFAGKYGTDTERGVPWGHTPDSRIDTVKVIALHFAPRPGDPDGANPDFDGFAVQMLGERREFLDPKLKRVVVDGRGSIIPISVTLAGDGKQDADPTSTTTQADLASFDKDAIIIGTDHDDQIQTGTANSWVDGRGGNDRIVTAEDATHVARVAGGPGNDTITTGNGNNFVSGDGTLGVPTLTQTVELNAIDAENAKKPSQVLTDLINWTKLVGDPTRGDQTGTGDDMISVGLGRNRVNGGPGNDHLGVASDRPDGTRSAGSVLIGGHGSDSIAGGSGPDVIYAVTEKAFGVDEPGEADPTSLLDGDGKPVPNIIETGSGNDVAYGSDREDVITSHSSADQHSRIIGGGGNDALVGGYGSDEIFGGPGHDYVIAEPSEVGAQGAMDRVDGVQFGPLRTVRHLPLPAGTAPSPKLLVGGTGNDHILGGDGPSTIFGDTLRDAATVGDDKDETCRPGDPVASDAVPEGTSEADGDGNDLIQGGAGVDTVSAGGADDRVLAGGGDDRVCGQQGDDVLFGGDGHDLIWGGTGGDRGYGDAGDDYVFGNAGDDRLWGQDGSDVLEGNNGADWLSGGADDDIVYGGTRAAGRADVGSADNATGDVIYGDAGADILVGDNGTVDDPTSSTDTPATPFDLAGTSPDAGRGDLVFGGAGDDTAYGGLGDDRINGGAGDDHLEGNNGSDLIHGDDGEDEIIGGSSQVASPGVGRPDTGDRLYGDAGQDVIVGDNAVITRDVSAAATTAVLRGRGFAVNRQVQLLDLGETPDPDNFGADEILGGDGNDVSYGQGGTDRIKGNAGDDYAEGGPGSDWVEGNAGDDDLVGGSSTPSGSSGPATTGQPDTADALFGGPGDDVVLGDNGQISRPLAGQSPTSVTVRLGSKPGQATPGRIIEQWDRSTGGSYLTAGPANRFGADRISGGDGVDVLHGQDGDDAITGDGGADYVEGNGGDDLVFGDLPLDGLSEHGLTVPALKADWPGSPSPRDLLIGVNPTGGQDDLIGGTSMPGYRDGNDTIEGNAGDDVVLGDNGTLLRTLVGPAGSQTEKVYTDRYPNGAVPADATVSRTHDPDQPGPSTRFCTTQQATCEVAGAFGDDVIYGGYGNDGIWGQDGNDEIHGEEGDDDLFGELGDDKIFGGFGRDAILGDRGGVVNQHLDADATPAQSTVAIQSPPKESFVAFPRGAYDRRVDLLHDVDGDEWIGSSTSPAMPHPGLTEGGRDIIRGGPDNDKIHAGFGNDLVNGDSGGDAIFGGDGEDVIWGGLGCDPTLDATTPDCLTDGVFDPSARGDGDRFVDHIFGGAGESDVAKQNVLGSDLLDVRPRGSYTPGTGCTLEDWPVTTGSKKDLKTVDPCLWFELTGLDDDDATNNNHHQGVDWIYGGWDRDVMQGDVTANGPNGGDRLIDWNGSYNLFTHCNAAYGGFNDVRGHSPAMRDFLQQLAFTGSAGRSLSDLTTPGTSAFGEIAIVYPSDNGQHGAGQAYPSTPGHFDETACQN